MNAQKVCNRCGKEISSGARVCPHCGTVWGNEVKSDPFIGRTLDKKYRVDSLLGSGGMGTVYRATRLMIGDEVAIKVLRTDRITDSQSIERFRREAQAAARLKHPNVVTIYDFALTSDGSAYIIMELVEGRSLRAMIEQEAPLTPQVAANIISQVSAALDEAHRQNIIHRDLKPDNIVINVSPGSLRVKVLDFGIAKLHDATSSSMTLTQTGTVIGTPHYMSPEQCMGEELDGRSDIYSLGIVLYEMLVGKVPFDAPSVTGIVLQQVSNQPPSIHERNPNISPAVERVVMDALEKDKAMRPQTADEFAAELIAAVTGASGGSRQSPRQTFGNEPATQRTRPATADHGPPRIVPPQQFYGGAQGWPPQRVQQPDKQSRPGLVAAVVILTIIALGALAAAGYFFFIKDKQRVAATDSGKNSPPTARSNTNVIAPVNANTANRQGNISIVSPPNPPNAEQAKQQVMAILQGWAAALNRHDFESYMSYYAPMLDVYYGRTNVALDTVRTDKARAFRIFSSFDARLTNIDIDVAFGTSSARAQATFDKTWVFSGDSYSTGSVQTRLLFVNLSGQWRITGEKDLKLYYKN